MKILKLLFSLILTCCFVFACGPKYYEKRKQKDYEKRKQEIRILKEKERSNQQKQKVESKNSDFDLGGDATDTMVDPSKGLSPLFLRKVDKEAEFPGGNAALNEYIFSNFVLSNDSSGLQGDIDVNIKIEFTVDKTGKADNFKWLSEVKGNPDGFTQLVKLLKPIVWIPAEIKGIKVNSYKTLPIIIRLDN